MVENNKGIPHEQVLAELGITQEEIVVSEALNPISLVRQSAKRRKTPDVLDVEELR